MIVRIRVLMVYVMPMFASIWLIWTEKIMPKCTFVSANQLLSRLTPLSYKSCFRCLLSLCLGDDLLLDLDNAKRISKFSLSFPQPILSIDGSLQSIQFSLVDYLSLVTLSSILIVAHLALQHLALCRLLASCELRTKKGRSISFCIAKLTFEMGGKARRQFLLCSGRSHSGRVFHYLGGAMTFARCWG